MFIRQRRNASLSQQMPSQQGCMLAGIPANSIWLGHPSSSFRRSASLAECGSLQLEWTALSERSGNSVYAAKSQKVFRAIHDVYPDQVSPSLALLPPSGFSATDWSEFCPGSTAAAPPPLQLVGWHARGKFPCSGLGVGPVPRPQPTLGCVRQCPKCLHQYRGGCCRHPREVTRGALQLCT